MRLVFAYTFDDYREANRAHARANKLRWLIRWSFTIFFLAGALLMLTVLITSARSAKTGMIEWEGIRPILPWLVIAGALLIYAPMASSIAVRRAWRGQPAMQLQQTMELDERGVTIDDKQSRNEFTWDAFIQFIETRKLFLIFPSKLTFIMIPKRAVPPPDLEPLRRRLRDRVGRLSAFPVALPPKQT